MNRAVYKILLAGVLALAMGSCKKKENIIPGGNTDNKDISIALIEPQDVANMKDKALTLKVGETKTLKTVVTSGDVLWSLTPQNGCGTVPAKGTEAIIYTAPAQVPAQDCLLTATAEKNSSAKVLIKLIITNNGGNNNGTTLPVTSDDYDLDLSKNEVAHLSVTSADDVTWSVDPASATSGLKPNAKTAEFTAPAPGDYTISAVSTKNASLKGSVKITASKGGGNNTTNPILSFTATPSSLTVGNKVKLTVTVSGGTIDWPTTPAGIVPLTSPNGTTFEAEFTPTSTGNYNITVTSSQGSQYSKTITITVSNPTGPTISVVASANPTTVEVKKTSALTATVTGSTQGVSWKVVKTPPGGNAQITPDPADSKKATFSADLDGAYMVEAVSLEDSKVKSTAISINVTKVTPVSEIIGISGPASMVEEEAPFPKFVALVNNCPNVNWTLMNSVNPGVILISKGLEVSIQTASGTAGLYTLQATCQSNPKSFKLMNFEVKKKVVPVTLSVTPNPISIEVDKSIDLTATPSKGGVTWTVQGSGTITTNGNKATYTAPSTPGVSKIVATSTEDPSVAVDVPITITAPSVDIKLTPDNKVIFLGDSVEITATASSGSVNWNVDPNPGPLQINGNTITFKPNIVWDYEVVAQSKINSSITKTAKIKVINPSKEPIGELKAACMSKNNKSCEASQSFTAKTGYYILQSSVKVSEADKGGSCNASYSNNVASGLGIDQPRTVTLKAAGSSEDPLHVSCTLTATQVQIVP